MAQSKWKVRDLREALADPRLDDYEIIVCYPSKVRAYERDCLLEIGTNHEEKEITVEVY